MTQFYLLVVFSSPRISKNYLTSYFSEADNRECRILIIFLTDNTGRHLGFFLMLFQVSKKKLREAVAEMITTDPFVGVTQLFRDMAEKMGARIDI